MKIKRNIEKKISAFCESRRIATAKIDFDAPRLNGPCMVLGSAPGTTLPDGWDMTYPLITVNASQAISDTFDMGMPEMTVINGAVLRTGTEKAKKYAPSQSVLASKTTKTLFLIESRINLDEARSKLADLEYEYSELVSCTSAQRARLTREVLRANRFFATRNGTKLSISTGFFAALLALYLGANPVVMNGFSITRSGHGYEDDVDMSRMTGRHVRGDIAALERIRDLGLPIRAADKQFAADSGLQHYRGT